MSIINNENDITDITNNADITNVINDVNQTERSDNILPLDDQNTSIKSATSNTPTIETGQISLDISESISESISEPISEPNVVAPISEPNVVAPNAILNTTPNLYSIKDVLHDSKVLILLNNASIGLGQMTESNEYKLTTGQSVFKLVFHDSLQFSILVDTMFVCMNRSGEVVLSEEVGAPGNCIFVFCNEANDRIGTINHKYGEFSESKLYIKSSVRDLYLHVVDGCVEGRQARSAVTFNITEYNTDYQNKVLFGGNATVYNNFQVYKQPIVLYDTDDTNLKLSSSIGMLYKKSNQIWWKTINKDVNLTDVVTQSDLFDVNTNLSNVNTNLSNVNTNLSNVNAELSDIKIDLSDMQMKYNTLFDTINSNTKDIAVELTNTFVKIDDKFNTTVKQIDENFFTLKTRLSTLEEKIPNSTPSIIQNEILLQDESSIGRLFKKIDDPNVYWSCDGVEKKLSEEFTLPFIPISDPNSYTFNHDSLTGMESFEVGKLSLVVGGNDIMVLTETDSKINGKLYTDDVTAKNVITNNINTKSVSTEKCNIGDAILYYSNGLNVLTPAGEVNINKRYVYKADACKADSNKADCKADCKADANSNIQIGDAIGIKPDLSAVKVTGGHWDHVSGVNNLLYIDVDYMIYTKDNQLIVKRTTEQLNIEQKDADLTYTLDMNVSKSSKCLMFNINGETRFVITCIKENRLYVYVFCINDQIKLVGVDYYNATHNISSFNIILDSEKNIIVAVVYFNNGLTMALFSTEPKIGCVVHGLLTEPILDADKSIHMVNIPGQKLIVSYGNYKVLVGLSWSHLESPVVNGFLIDADSIDCLNMIYDIASGTTISLERTITNACFLQVLDVYGMSLEILKSKTIHSYGTNRPLGMYFNGEFFIIYTTNEIDKIYAYVVSNNDNLIIKGCYTQQTNMSQTNMSQTNMSQTNMQQINMQQNTDCQYHNEHVLYNGDLYKFVTSGIAPENYIGLAKSVGEYIEVALKGSVIDNLDIPVKFIGKKIYMDKPDKHFPHNVTINETNVLIGTVISYNSLIVGL